MQHTRLIALLNGSRHRLGGAWLTSRWYTRMLALTRLRIVSRRDTLTDWECLTIHYNFNALFVKLFKAFNRLLAEKKLRLVKTTQQKPVLDLVIFHYFNEVFCFLIVLGTIT